VKTPFLLEVPQTHPTNRDKLQAFKSVNEIWTHSDKFDHSEGKWIALLLPGNPHGNLPYEDCMESEDPWDIVAGYCRVLEESGYLTNGKTERDAVEALCRKRGIPFDL
jgi:hypothetical protein